VGNKSLVPVIESMVRFEGVQKSYDGETLVVKGLNLEIANGEFLTMLGPSGSGKTTTLMMLAGFEPATHGEIFVQGKPINNSPLVSAVCGRTRLLTWNGLGLLTVPMPRTSVDCWQHLKVWPCFQET
jgi:ABC-type nitrate/sulfonate/bicarbonate transport system ATPase subunit